MKKWLAVLLSFMLLVSAVSAFAETWTCPACGNVNQENFCTSCGAKRPELWVCPGCGRENNTAFCGNCGTAKPAEDAETEVSGGAVQESVSDHSDDTDLAVLMQLYPFPEEYRGMIITQAREYSLDPMLVAAVIRNESSFRPAAESAVGSRGLMQLMPDTAAWIAGKLEIADYTLDSLYDPETNIRFGCWLLHYYSELFNGDAVCTVAAYHAGQARVKKWLADPAISDDGLTIAVGKLPNEQTSKYVQRVLKSYQVYQELYAEGYELQDFSLFICGYLQDTDGLKNYLEQVRSTAFPDLKSLEWASIMPDEYSLVQLAVWIGANEGGVYIVPREAFLSLSYDSAFLPLEDDEKLMSFVGNNDIAKGWRSIGDEVHLYGIPLDVLPGANRYFSVEDGFVCAFAGDTDPNAVKALLRILCRDFKEQTE